MSIKHFYLKIKSYINFFNAYNGLAPNFLIPTCRGRRPVRRGGKEAELNRIAKYLAVGAYLFP
jgi:hypothetical protein